ncbi:MAG: hypothetical protein CM15mP36_13150 [Flavobacteriales bacterium]|nr:MAG: hypothetical protein CM15mP36_13150 [Flavobacteriales bacterium]
MDLLLKKTHIIPILLTQHPKQSDHLVKAFNKTYGLNTTISHSSNNYGYKQNVEKIIPKKYITLK